MKRKLLILFLSLILILGLISGVFAITFSQEDKGAINLCKKDCVSDKKSEITSCHSSYSSCLNSCNLNSSLTKSDRLSCSKSCKSERKICLKITTEGYQQCKKDCPYKALNTNVKCVLENQTYNAGEKFQNKCESCRCNYDGNVKCEKLPNCGFSNFTISESSCTSNQGLYQKLCNGPYFGQKCSSINFCQCSGINNYSCPSNTTCLKNFTISDIPMIIPKWTDRSGNPLGDIGICANNQIMGSCGNSICENKITKNNSIVENHLNCPQDCD
ncbi:MAG: hypothetical protein AABX03_01070 [Nanoarchaeota archaeon]